MSAIAITDYHGIHNAVSFYQSAQKSGIKPIIGTEFGFVLNLDGIMDSKQIGNICVLAKNKTGYHNLLKLVSYANMEWLKEKQKIDIFALKKRSEWLLVFMWGPNSRIGKMLMRGEKTEKIYEIIEMLKDVVWEKNVYGEIIAQDHSLDNSIKKINEKALPIFEDSKLRIITNNVFDYLKKDDKDAREMALAIKDGYKMYDEQRRKPPGDYHIATESEIREILLKNGYETIQIDERIATNESIADEVNTEIDLYQSLFPNYETPPKMKEIYDKHKDTLIEKK